MELTPDDLYQHRDFLYALALDLVADEHEAEDLVQSALLYALQRPPRKRGAVRSWFRKVVRHMAINSLVSSRRRREREQRVSAAEATEDSTLSRLEVRMEVLRAVEQLDELYRDPIILYYLEELGTSDVARRLGLPLATVKTRLSRGREQLRERLERRSIGAGSLGLVALLVPLVEWRGSLWRQLRVPVLAGTAAVGAALVAVPLLRGTGPSPPPSELDSGALVTRDPSPGAGSTVAVSAGVEPAGLAEPAAPARLATRPEAPVRETEGAPERTEFLVRDAWGRGVPDLDLVLATDEGTVLDGRAPVRSDGSGRGFLDPPASLSFLRPEGDAWVPLYEGVVDPERPARPAVVVVAPAREVRGRLVDVRGEPVGGARLRARVELPVPLDPEAAARKPLIPRARSDGSGAFAALLPDLPMTTVEVAHPGHQRWRHVGLDFDLPIVLTAVFELARPIVGRVVDPLGVGVAPAVVSLGTGAVRTQADGRFRISWTEPDPALRRQVAARVGEPVLQAYAPGVGFGETPLEAGPEARAYTLVLDRSFGELRGRVVGADGVPREGVKVWVEDPTFLAYPGTHPLEALESGRATAHVLTDAAGAFVHRVLDDREYSLCARDGTSGAWARARAAAGRGPLELSLASPRRVDLEGSVVTAGGEPVAAARVEVVQLDSGTAFGRGVLVREETRLAAAESDRGGGFRFEDLDPDRASLRVWCEGFVPHTSELSGVSDVTVVLEPGLELRLRHDRAGERLVRFYRGEDERPLPVLFPLSSRGWSSSDRTWWVVEPGRFEAAVIPVGATRLELLVESEGREVLELERKLPPPDLQAGIDLDLTE